MSKQDMSEEMWRDSQPKSFKEKIKTGITITGLGAVAISGIGYWYIAQKDIAERNDRLRVVAVKLAAEDGFKVTGRPEPNFQSNQSGTFDVRLILPGCSAHAIAHAAGPFPGDLPTDITDYSVQLPDLPDNWDDRYVNVTNMTALASPTEGLGPNYCRVINGVDPAPAGVRTEP